MITPQRLQKIGVQVCKDAAKDIKTAADETINTGWLIFGIAKPNQRLQAYEQSTLPGDRALVLTDNYLDLMRAGVMPHLECEALWQQAKAPIQVPDPMTGQVVTQIPPDPEDMSPFFWAILLTLPDKFFLFHQSDFRRLIREKEMAT